MKTKIFITACLVMILAMALVIPLATVSADYEEDILNNPNAIVTMNQLINSQLDYTNSEVDSRDFFVENITINDQIFQSQVIGSTGWYYTIVTSSSDISGTLVLKHSGASRDLWVYSQSNFNVYIGHKYYICMNNVGVNASVLHGLHVMDFIFIDLTLMFGSGNEPNLQATVPVKDAPPLPL